MTFQWMTTVFKQTSKLEKWFCVHCLPWAAFLSGGTMTQESDLSWLAAILWFRWYHHSESNSRWVVYSPQTMTSPPIGRRNAKPSYRTQGTVSGCRRIHRDVRAACILVSENGEKIHNSCSLGISTSGLQAIKEHKYTFPIDHSVIYIFLNFN